jgi:hypothetical protein
MERADLGIIGSPRHYVPTGYNNSPGKAARKSLAWAMKIRGFCVNDLCPSSSSILPVALSQSPTTPFASLNKHIYEIVAEAKSIICSKGMARISRTTPEDCASL